MSEIEIIFEKLFDFYKVGNINSLSNALNSAPSTVSNWKQRNSISAIKKRCRELGIYNEIFGAGDSNTQKIKDNHGQIALKVEGDQNFETAIGLIDRYPEIKKIIETALAASDGDATKVNNLKSCIKEWIIENL